ncbi:BRCA2-interacting transcriptional repressor EMSY-like isoform X1 [Acipenser oxyrinchus oxyrinchus]|uniref:BRCA2-interacting transcriptional repressor EMSY n=1 Tax=Acipenser oxyrinchus oxyrinchus TaxID=40147 RepID=A0AAD8DGP8_ACIOX|nr:BRCA2-interacting transcriptional repressor EMSY-like isoform X1 [Acipenser oxyrinchus oxyrinchus]
MFMIHKEKPQPIARMPVVWPTLLDLNRDECKRILRKLELEAYAGVISALRAQGDLTKEKKDLLGELNKVLSISTERHRAEVRRAVNDERLTTIAYHMSGPNSSSEWSIEGRRLVPLMPRLVPQTAFTVTANAVASATAQHNTSLLLPAETGNKEVVVCYSYTSTTSTPATATVPSGSAAPVKSPRPASPASNVVVLPSGSTVYVKSVSCSDEDEKPRKRRRTNSSSSSPVVLKEIPKAATPIPKTITVPVSGSPKMSNIMQSIANSLPPHMSPVKITFTKPSTQSTSSSTQKVIIVTTSPSSTFMPNILSKSHNYAAVTKLVSTSMLTAASQKQPIVITASQSSLATGSSGSATLSPALTCVAVTTVISSSPSVVMSTIAQGVSSAAVKVASARLPSPKSLMGSPTQILAQFPKHQHQHSPKHLAQPSMGAVQQQCQTAPGIKPTIQIKQESGEKMQDWRDVHMYRGVKIITQQMQPSKILPKPSTSTLPSSSSSSPIMVVSSNGTIMTTKLVSTPTGTQATYSRPTVTPTIGARVAAAPGGATYVKTTSGSIITVVPKSLATLGGKIISSNIVSGTTTKITTIPMTSKPNVIVVQKTTGKGTTIQGLPGKNVVTTLLNAGIRYNTEKTRLQTSLPACLSFDLLRDSHLQESKESAGEKTLQAVPSKPAIITATRPITKMIVTQPKGMGSGVQPATKIIPTKIVYGQQGKTQVLIKPKPMAFQATVVSEQTRQLVSETLQQVSRASETGGAASQEGVLKEELQTFPESSSSSTESSHSSQDSQPVVHVITSRGQEWAEHEVSVESSPTIIYQDVPGESQSATSTIKALLELQQTTVKEKGESKPRQHTIDLSQMAVPIQMAQEKRQSPESPVITAVESDLITEYITTGKSAKAAMSSASISSGEVALTSLLSASQPQSTSLQRAPQQTAPQTPVMVKSIPASSALAVTRFVKQAVTSQVVHSKQAEDLGREEGEVEGDTLDPQTGLFYRSAQQLKQASQQQDPPKLLPPAKPATVLNQGAAQQPALYQQQQQQQQLKPVLQHHLVVKERQVSGAGAGAQAQAQQTVVQVIAVKPPHTPQLPKLQQAPSSQNRPIHTVLSQPPPLQAHHPVSSDKPTMSQVQQPIITQGATVTKITFGSHQPATISKPASGEAAAKLSPVSSTSPAPFSEKSSVSDILKISMLEAQIDPSVEPMVVDSSSDCTFSKGAAASQIVASGQLISSTASPVVQSSQSKQLQQSLGGAGTSLHGQFTRIQNLPAQKSKEVDIIQVIPQYSITPDSSQSNVVVEPSGFLEITNFTSQSLEEETVMEQEVDSSNDEGMEASPSQSSIDQSQ